MSFFMILFLSVNTSLYIFFLNHLPFERKLHKPYMCYLKALQYAIVKTKDILLLHKRLVIIKVGKSNLDTTLSYNSLSVFEIATYPNHVLYR